MDPPPRVRLPEGPERAGREMAARRIGLGDAAPPTCHFSIFALSPPKNLPRTQSSARAKKRPPARGVPGAFCLERRALGGRFGVLPGALSASWPSISPVNDSNKRKTGNQGPDQASEDRDIGPFLCQRGLTAAVRVRPLVNRGPGNRGPSATTYPRFPKRTLLL
jgi:hypothetical protein